MKRGLGLIILQIAVALFLLVSGVTGMLSSSAGDLTAVVGFLKNLLQNPSIVNIVIIVLSVCEIIAGFFLLTELFTTDLRITDMILVVFIVLWIANIILVDFVGPIGEGSVFKDTHNILHYLSTLSSHLMVLGALILVARKFD